LYSKFNTVSKERCQELFSERDKKAVNYKNLFKSTDVTHVGVIGTGAFGRSFLAQSRLTPGIRVPVVCDQDLETAGMACLRRRTRRAVKMNTLIQIFFRPSEL